jgi:hypothetical protein
MLFGFLAPDLGEKMGLKKKKRCKFDKFCQFLGEKNSKVSTSRNWKNKKNQTLEVGTSCCLIFLHQR